MKTLNQRYSHLLLFVLWALFSSCKPAPNEPIAKAIDPNENPRPKAENDFFTTVEDSFVAVSVLANDSDQDPNGVATGLDKPFIAIVPKNGAATVQGDSTILYTPNVNFFGADTFYYSIQDKIIADVLHIDTALVTMTVTPVNDTPKFKKSPNDQSDSTGAVITLPPPEIDDQGDRDQSSFVFSAQGLPPDLNIEPGSGVISGTISTAALQFPGTIYDITLTVTDSGGLSDSVPFAWRVDPPNTPPVIDTNLPNRINDEGVGINLTLQASDADGDALTWTFANLPLGLNGTSENKTARIIGAISYDAVSISGGNKSYPVRVVLMDEKAGSDTATFTWTVNNVNRAPVIALQPAISEITVAAGQTKTIAVAVSDPDGNVIATLALGSQTPVWATLSRNTANTQGNIIISPDATVASGNYPVEIKASDGENDGLFSFTIKVE